MRSRVDLKQIRPTAREDEIRIGIVRESESAMCRASDIAEHLLFLMREIAGYLMLCCTALVNGILHISFPFWNTYMRRRQRVHVFSPIVLDNTDGSMRAVQILFNERCARSEEHTSELQS